jgi:N-terminal acetyltransferase B complex non-catalytic subunit
MNLQKTYPKKREYYFWAVLSCYLLCVSILKENKLLLVDFDMSQRWSGATESERKLFGALAYRMVSKAASDVPDDPVRKGLYGFSNDH